MSHHKIYKSIHPRSPIADRFNRCEDTSDENVNPSLAQSNLGRDPIVLNSEAMQETGRKSAAAGWFCNFGPHESTCSPVVQLSRNASQKWKQPLAPSAATLYEQETTRDLQGQSKQPTLQFFA
jgi:hypothetical protein